MDVFSRPEVRAECFFKKFILNLSPPEHFYMVQLTFPKFLLLLEEALREMQAFPIFNRNFKAKQLLIAA